MKIKVIDITFVNYVNLEDKSQYNYYLRYAELKAIDLFDLGELIDMPFGFVKDVQDMFYSSGLTWESYIELISEYKEIDKKDIVLHSLFDLQKSRLYLKDQIETITDLERKNLNHTSRGNEQAAGIDIFEKYRSFIQFDELAGGDITKYDKIREIPYSVCFTKLKLQLDRSVYQENLNKIK